MFDSPSNRESEIPVVLLHKSAVMNMIPHWLLHYYAKRYNTCHGVHHGAHIMIIWTIQIDYHALQWHILKFQFIREGDNRWWWRQVQILCCSCYMWTYKMIITYKNSRRAHIMIIQIVQNECIIRIVRTLKWMPSPRMTYPKISFQ